MRTAATTTSWVEALARLRPRDRNGARTGRAATRTAAPGADRVALRAAPRVDTPPARIALKHEHACAITGAKRAKKKCCRSTPRCKGCPVVLMRAARAAESGLTGKDLAKAVKRARAA